jgi:hypothetical protein
MATIRAIRPDMEQPRGAVSNAVYDIVCMFQSKLEALAAYEKYVGDFKNDPNGRKLVEQIRADDERHVGLLRDEIERLCREGKFR